MENEITQLIVGAGIVSSALVYLAKKSLDKTNGRLDKFSRELKIKEQQVSQLNEYSSKQRNSISKLQEANSKREEKFKHIKEQLDNANMAIRDEILDLTKEVKSIATLVGKNRPFTKPKKVKKVVSMPEASNVWVVDYIDHAPYASLDAFMIQLRATDEPRVIAFQTLEVIIKIPANKTNFKVLDNVVLGTNIKVMGGGDTGMWTFTGERWMQLKLK